MNLIGSIVRGETCISHARIFDGPALVSSCIFRLFSLLSDPFSEAIHSAVIDTIVALVTLLQSLDLACFRHFIEDSIDALRGAYFHRCGAIILS